MGKETGPAMEAPSACAAGDVATRLFGEEPPGKYVVVGRLIRSCQGCASGVVLVIAQLV